MAGILGDLPPALPAPDTRTMSPMVGDAGNVIVTSVALFATYPLLGCACCEAPVTTVHFNAPGKFVNPLPLPEKLPLRLTPLALFVRIAVGSCASATTPVRLAAGTVPSRLLELPGHHGIPRGQQWLQRSQRHERAAVIGAHADRQPRLAPVNMPARNPA